MNYLNIIRSLARVIGSLVVAFILVFLISDLFGDEKVDKGPLLFEDKIAFLFFPLSTLVGLLTAWKWEGVGGLITILGLLGLLIIRPDLSSAILLVALVAVPALLYLVYWYLAKRMSIK